MAGALSSKELLGVSSSPKALPNSSSCSLNFSGCIFGTKAPIRNIYNWRSKEESKGSTGIVFSLSLLVVCCPCNFRVVYLVGCIAVIIRGREKIDGCS